MSLARVYHALVEAGASPQAATDAMEALEESQDEPWKRRVEADIKLLKWMLGANIALTSGIGLALLRILAA